MSWRRRAAACPLVWLVCWAGGCSSSPPPLPPSAPPSALGRADRPAPPRPREASDSDWFEDVTADSGVNFQYSSGAASTGDEPAATPEDLAKIDALRHTLLETVGGGAAMLDFDGDGDLDLYVAGGGGFRPPENAAEGKLERVAGRAGALFRNDGGWRFVDVTQAAGLDRAVRYTHGCCVLDFDRDQFPDLLVTGFGGCSLYHNRQDGTFQDVAEQAGIDCPFWCTAAAAADYDGDGRPDIYVAGYCQWSLEAESDQWCGDRRRQLRDVCPPQQYDPAPDRLFRNLGGGKFEDVTREAGIRDDGRALGVLAADLDEDGRQDFYVANDAGANFCYFNQGEGFFREQAVVRGLAYQEYGLAEGSMGVDIGDYDGDGRPDLFVTNFALEENSLYRSTGGGDFAHATVSARLTGDCFPYVGFGTALADFDGDGWQDLLVVNGHVFYRTGQVPYRQPPMLFRNTGEARFENVGRQAAPYFTAWHAARGAAVGDLDDDGALDIVVVHQNDPVTLLRNRRPPGCWLRVELQGTDSDPRAMGARLRYHFDGRQLTRWVASGRGYLSTFDPRVVLPCGDEGPLEVEVSWPGGRRETFSGLKRRQTNLLVEGAGRGTTLQEKEQVGQEPEQAE